MMFGFGRGYGFGRGFGFGRGGGRGGGGFGRGYGPGRGACFGYYQAYGTWPAWSRWAGGPGYWRSQVMQGDVPTAWDTPIQPAGDEITVLRQEVQQMREEINTALQRLAALNK